MVRSRGLVIPSCLDLQRRIALAKIVEHMVGATMRFIRSQISMFVKIFVIEVD